MPNQTKLITKTDVSTWTGLSKHVEDKRIDPHILSIQDRYLYGLLGKALYDTLLAQKEADTLTVDNQALVNELTPYIAYKVAAAYLPFSGVMHQQKGALMPSDNHGKNISSKMLEAQVNAMEQSASTHRRNVLHYLQNNKASFPTWDEQCASDSHKTPFRITPVKRINRGRFTRHE